jgi:hypothetical protein
MPFDTKVDTMLAGEINKEGEKLTINKRVEIEGHFIH